MKKVLLITSSPVAGGNGYALIEAAKAEVEKARRQGADCPCSAEKNRLLSRLLCLRKNRRLHSKKTILWIFCVRFHEADAVIAAAPIYYNCMAAQMITLVNRLCCTFACKTYQIGPKKKVGRFLNLYRLRTSKK